MPDPIPKVPQNCMPAGSRLERSAGSLAIAVALIFVVAVGVYVRSLWATHRQEVRELAALNRQTAAARLYFEQSRDELASLATAADARTLAAIIAAPGSQRLLLTPLPSAPKIAQAHGFAVVSRHPDRGRIELTGLPPAPSGHVYQLSWLVPHGAPQLAALFHPAPDGWTALTPLEIPAGEKFALELSLEHDGGSVPPAGPILMATLAAPPDTSTAAGHR
ncbi:MAG TPA: anti-sigma factor [Candidatus Binataceae bacterium]|nr:anti-sigma factor [Candidatus Binataceae bacterium]